MLVPPDNFGLVETGVYRCSKLESDHFPFLETLQLRLLIVLDAEKPPRMLKAFLETNDIDCYNLGALKISNHHRTGANSNIGEGDDANAANAEVDVVAVDLKPKEKNDQWMLIENNIILRAFELLLNKSKHNVLLVDLTLTLVGILRKVQKWNFNSIVNEYRIYTGAASKSNYFAENFLELVQTELVPYEIDQLSKKFTSLQLLPQAGAAAAQSPEVHHSQPISYEPTFDDMENNDNDDDDLTDDDLLSASPQIPQNLLKLVEKRKQEMAHPSHLHDSLEEARLGSSGASGRRRVSPGSSPSHHAHLRRSSVNNEVFLSSALGGRRRLSIDSKLWASPLANNKFRSVSNTPIDLPVALDARRQSFKGSKDHDLQRLKDQFDYKFYKNLNKYPVSYENVNVIRIKLPPDEKLPAWFVNTRNHWETNFRKINNIS